MLILGNITLDDFILRRGKKYNNILGGPPSYSSFALNSLFGVRVGLCSSLGKDFPKKYMKRLKSIAEIYITERNNTTRFKIVDIEPRKMFLLAFSGEIENVDLSIDDVYMFSPVYKEIKIEYLNEASHMGLVTLDPQGFFRRIGKDNEVYLSTFEQFDYIVKRVNILRMSLDEFSVLHITNIRDYVKGFVKKGVELAVITSSVKVYYATRECYGELPTYRKVQVVSSTGAGDVFTSVLTYIYSKTTDPVKALAYSIVAAGLSVEKLGPLELDRDRFWSSLKEYKELAEI